jgi:hypothetical protein
LRAQISLGCREELSKSRHFSHVSPAQRLKFVQTEWDLDGSGSYSVKADLQSTRTADLSTELVHSFDKSGTYFVTLRAASQRDGDDHTPFARVQNLGRARVVVR